jgi:release factor glutamine methyltransferase
MWWTLWPPTTPNSDLKPLACDPVESPRPTVASLLLRAKRDLAEAGVPSPDVDAEMLVGHVLGVRRSDIYLESGAETTGEEAAAILDLIERRVRRIPLQLLLGEWEFMSLTFKVREGVFIPRPETEILVESVIERFAAGGEHVGSILDIGTGTGVVGISLAACLHPDLVVATDVSLVAVEIARTNAILNQVKAAVVFVVCDGLSAIGEKGAVFDVVVCNPPYVASGRIPGLEPEVRDHDPLWALDGGPDGLRFIAGLLPRIPSVLKRGGLVAFEVGAAQGPDVKMLFEQAGFGKVEVVRDLAGLDRVIVGRSS